MGGYKAGGFMRLILIAMIFLSFANGAHANAKITEGKAQGQTDSTPRANLPVARQELGQAPGEAVAATAAAPDAKLSAAPEKFDEAPKEAVPTDASTPAGNASGLPSLAVAEWEKRFEKLSTGIQTGQVTQKDADQFYQELSVALAEARKRLRQALAATGTPATQPARIAAEKDANRESETKTEPAKSQEPLPHATAPEDHKHERIEAEQLLMDLNALYRLRIQTLALVSPELRDRVTGTGSAGLQAFREELDYLSLRSRYHIKQVPRIGQQVIVSTFSAPLHAVPLVIQIVLAVMIFIWWRRWAAQGIDRIRGYILDMRPRKTRHKQTAKLLWYLKRVRRPIEWLILLTVLWQITGPHEDVFQILIGTQVRYILIVWLLVNLINAMADRGTAGLKSETARLRLRSIWLIFIWFLFVAIGVDITTDLAGKGALYTWFRMLSGFLVVPVLFLIIYWWRPEIYRKLGDDSQQPTFIKNILQNRRGPGSYLGAALGGGYLLWDVSRQWLLRGIAAFEWGRHLIANLTRIEAVRISERQRRQHTYEPITAEMRNRLYTCEGRFVESAGRNILEQMDQLVANNRRGEAIIVAERGGGKTQLIERLDDRLGKRMIMFDCPPGGLDAFYQAIAEALELNAVELTSDLLEECLKDRQVKAIGIDNLHRMSRPALGGQQELDRVLEMIRAIDADVFWFYGIDWAAWQYIFRVRADRMIVNDVLNLPLWTENQIRELIEMRSAQAGINPDFGEITLPRQFVDLDYETVEERNRFGFYRILWNAADGNPAVALQLWADSLRVAPDGRILALLPQLPATEQLDKVTINALLILRVIAQSGYANQQQIVDSLKIPGKEVNVTLRFALTREWVELTDGWYRLSWKWFRTITRVLARQNLLVRRTL